MIGLTPTLEGLQIFRAASEQIAAVTCFQRRDVVFEHTAKPHHLESMGAQCFLMMIAQGYEQEHAGEECNDDNADGCAGEQFEVEMLWTEKPSGTAADHASTDLAVGRCVDLGHYKFHKSK